MNEICLGFYFVPVSQRVFSSAGRQFGLSVYHSVFGWWVGIHFEWSLCSMGGVHFPFSKGKSFGVKELNIGFLTFTAREPEPKKEGGPHAS